MVHRFQILFAVMALSLSGVAEAGRTGKRLNDAKRGEELYNRHCVQCHGETAKGDGPATVDLVFPVPDLQTQMLNTNRDDFVKSVLDGSGPMPGFVNSFDGPDARRVVKYMEKASRGVDAEDIVEEEVPDNPEDDAPADDAPADDAPADDAPDQE